MLTCPAMCCKKRAALGLLPLLAPALLPAQDPLPRDSGYRGVWYYNQKSQDEYVYKYSGGLGTYCAKHQPFAVYCKAIDKTFFCFGGTTRDSYRRLHHLVSYYDHKTGTVPRPVILLDKQTSDAHDNPVLSVDDQGHIWIFSTSHGRVRPSYIHKSVRPYDISAFEKITPTFERARGGRGPFDNFSYFQAWHVKDQGFACFFTRYGSPAARTSMFVTSPDGISWSRWHRLAAIDKGHYQISVVDRGVAACCFNYHPEPKGLNWRTNLYYLETRDLGKSWQNAAGQRLEVPVRQPQNPALVHEYEKEGLKVYLKDIRLDAARRPAILFITSKGYQSGPANNPRTWRLARFDGKSWAIHDITTSDNNYDMGSLFYDQVGGREEWRVIAPTGKGPQAFNPGGEVQTHVSTDGGKTWRLEAQLTERSAYNHTYVRRPVQAHPDFYAIWADGHGRKPSGSRLYFATRDGKVFLLPPRMSGAQAAPLRIR